MRLGELKTKTRNCDGRQLLCLSDYRDGTVKKIEIDMATESHIFFRVVEDDVD